MHRGPRKSAAWNVPSSRAAVVSDGATEAGAGVKVQPRPQGQVVDGVYHHHHARARRAHVFHDHALHYHVEVWCVHGRHGVCRCEGWACSCVAVCALRLVHHMGGGVECTHGLVPVGMGCHMS